MITNNISANTFFFAKVGNRHCLPYTLFIPFRGIIIPFYTALYLNEKHIKSSPGTFQPFQNFNYTGLPVFFKFIPSGWPLALICDTNTRFFDVLMPHCSRL